MKEPALLPTSPADEYDRRLAARREELGRSLTRLAWVAVCVHGLAVAAAGSAGITGDRRLWDPAGSLWVVGTLLASASAFVCVRNWRFRTRRLAVLGLAPWVAVVAEPTVVFVLLLLGIIR